MQRKDVKNASGKTKPLSCQHFVGGFKALRPTPVSLWANGYRVAPITLALTMLALTVTGTAQAQIQKQVSLTGFFQTLQTSPELEAARASVRAAEANVAQARNPAVLDAGFSSRAPSDTLDNFADTRLTVGVTAYPFVYGEQGDVIRLRELELEKARLGLKLAQVRLEALALESASDVQLSQQAIGLARTAVTAAEASYRTSRLRFERGAATAQEVRNANAGRQQAQNLLLSADANLELAQATLTSLVGNARLSSLPELALPRGTAVSLRDADRAVEAAQVGSSGAIRPFLPVATLDYTYNADNQSRVSASINSSNFAPRLGYSFDNDGYGESGSLSLSVSATLSPEQFSNITRLEETQRAALAARRAAERNATLTESQIRSRWGEADRNEQLARLVLQNAERTLSEVRKREQLGIGSTLETQAAAIALAQAGLDLRDSYRERFLVLMELYEFYGLPPSELVAAPRLETKP